MKKVETITLYILMLGIVGCLAWSCSNDDDPYYQEIGKYDLPIKARDFIDTYFPRSIISKIDMDPDYDGAEYEVEFRDGTEVEFDGYGDWIKVKAKDGRGVPDAIVPEEIWQFVDFRYPDERIEEISRHLVGWEVELSNDVEIRFSNDFRVLEIDD